MVGAGGFREFWEEIFIPKMKDFAVPVAAVDVSEEALKLPVKYGTVPAEKCYTDPRTAIEENPCDFLVLMIPPRARMQYIDLAIECGLDVVCEKPLADTMEHACEIYVKMRDAGLKVSVTYGTVYSVVKEQARDVAVMTVFQLGGPERVLPATPIRLVPPNMSLYYSFHFQAFFSGSDSIFFKIFFRRRSPLWIPSCTELAPEPSLFAISDILMPRRK